MFVGGRVLRLDAPKNQLTLPKAVSKSDLNWNFRFLLLQDMIFGTPNGQTLELSRLDILQPKITKVDCQVKLHELKNGSVKQDQHFEAPASTCFCLPKPKHTVDGRNPANHLGWC